MQTSEFTDVIFQPIIKKDDQTLTQLICACGILRKTKLIIEYCAEDAMELHCDDSNRDDNDEVIKDFINFIVPKVNNFEIELIQLEFDFAEQIDEIAEEIFSHLKKTPQYLNHTSRLKEDVLLAGEKYFKRWSKDMKELKEKAVELSSVVVMEISRIPKVNKNIFNEKLFQTHYQLSCIKDRMRKLKEKFCSGSHVKTGVLKGMKKNIIVNKSQTDGKKKIRRTQERENDGDIEILN